MEVLPLKKKIKGSEKGEQKVPGHSKGERRRRGWNRMDLHKAQEKGCNPKKGGMKRADQPGVA